MAFLVSEELPQPQPTEQYHALIPLMIINDGQCNEGWFWVWIVGCVMALEPLETIMDPDSALEVVTPYKGYSIVVFGIGLHW